MSVCSRKVALVTATLALIACNGAEQAPPQSPAAATPPSTDASASAAPIAPASAPTQVATVQATPPEPLTDEGMWLTNDFPVEKVQELYHFTPTQAWLDHVRLSSVRIGGCSASLVSPNGLVMTNHHCARSCVQQLSTKAKDFIKAGFYAETGDKEVKCPEIEVNQLTQIDDVTARVQAATAGLSDKAFTDAERGTIATLEKECSTSADVRCDVVNLYHGGRYHLYKYRRYQDVRLVFAPEDSIAFFGGDPDNFNFPRFNLDVSFVRVYDQGKPLASKDYLKWSETAPKEGDVTFVSGNPGATSRQLTVSQLVYLRDYALPRRLMAARHWEGVLEQFMKRGAEEKRIAKSELFGFQNAIKALGGRREALADRAFMADKARREKELRDRVSATESARAFAGAWDAIDHVQAEKAEIAERYRLLEGNPSRPLDAGLGGTLFSIARMLVRAGDELAKPNEKRLKEFSESKIPALKQKLFSTAPVYPDFETLKLEYSLIELRQLLGADDPVVKKTLGKDDVAELAARLVRGSKLADARVRKALFDGGAAAVAQSKDPMILLAKLIDDDARQVRSRYEDHVESVEKKFGEQIAKAGFAIYGTHVYPDATGTLRLSFGHIAGWKEGDRAVAPFTTFGGAFDRATGNEPFDLPKSWVAAKDKLDPATPFDVATTNDIIGGNSGSPLVNKEGEAIGLVFDGNIHSLAGDYGYEPKNNRSTSVTTKALMTALEKIYGAKRIVTELRGK